MMLLFVAQWHIGECYGAIFSLLAPSRHALGTALALPRRTRQTYSVVC